MSDANEREVILDAPFDLAATVRPLTTGFGDPTRRILEGRWLWATRTREGPATLAVSPGGPDRLLLRGFGPGASVLLTEAPAALGLDRPPPGCKPSVARLARRARGIRLPRLTNLFEPLVLFVLQQLVSGKEAARAFRELVRSLSEPAPGPNEIARGLWLPPSRESLARLPAWACAPLGIPPRQAETLRQVALHADRIDTVAGLSAEGALSRLLSLPGIGPWTATSLLLHARGEPDVVPIGDLHLPSFVAYTLAGEERADDRRMLELLAPHRGQRGWLVRWIHAAGQMAPRRHPRRPLRPLPAGRDTALRALRAQREG